MKIGDHIDQPYCKYAIHSKYYNITDKIGQHWKWFEKKGTQLCVNRNGLARSLVLAYLYSQAKKPMTILRKQSSPPSYFTSALFTMLCLLHGLAEVPVTGLLAELKIKLGDVLQQLHRSVQIKLLTSIWIAPAIKLLISSEIISGITYVTLTRFLPHGLKCSFKQLYLA